MVIFQVSNRKLTNTGLFQVCITSLKCSSSIQACFLCLLIKDVDPQWLFCSLISVSTCFQRLKPTQAISPDTQRPMSNAGKLTWSKPSLLRDDAPRRDAITVDPGRMVKSRQRAEQCGCFLPSVGNKMCKENEASSGLLGVLPSVVSSGNFPGHQIHSFHDYWVTSSQQGNDKCMWNRGCSWCSGQKGQSPDLTLKVTGSLWESASLFPVPSKWCHHGDVLGSFERMLMMWWER